LWGNPLWLPLPNGYDARSVSFQSSLSETLVTFVLRG